MSIAAIADYMVDEYFDWRGIAQPEPLSARITVNIDGLSAENAALARQAMALWEEVADIVFVETTGSAVITYSDDRTSGATTYRNDGAIVISIANGRPLKSYIHETGHALGLGHTGPYNGTAVWGQDNLFSDDTRQWSVMSYFSQDQNGSGSDSIPVTPQMADIMAIQSIYGAPASSNAGDTIYSPKVGTAMTLYDTDGRDTIDCSAYTGPQTLSVACGSLSSVMGGRNNLYIASNTKIEVVYGGAGDDELIGGAGKNTMNGGGGADTFYFAADIKRLKGDRIGDFDRKEGDIIDLFAIDAKKGGSDNTFTYIGDESFSKKGEVSFHNGKLKLNTDNDHGAEAVMFLNTDPPSQALL